MRSIFIVLLFFYFMPSAHANIDSLIYKSNQVAIIPSSSSILSQNGFIYIFKISKGFKKLYFWNDNYTGPVNLHYSLFNDGFFVFHSHFDQFLADGCMIRKSVMIGFSDFNDLNLNQITCLSSTTIREDSIKGSFEMQQSLLNEVSYFINNIFLGSAKFNDSKWMDDISFEGDVFNDWCLFNGTHFDSTVEFSGVQFKKTSFSGCQFDSTVQFEDITWGDTLDFSNIQTRSVISLLNYHKQYHRCRINLLNTDLSKLKLDYQNFQLYFPKGTSDEAKLNLYQGLLNKFKQEGLAISYEKLDKEFRHFNNTGRNDFNILLLAEDIFSTLWWDYGYRKWLVIFWALGIVLFFAIINMRSLGVLITEVYPMNKLKVPETDAPWYRRFKISLIYTSVIFFSFTLKLESIEFNRTGFLIRFLIIYLLGLFTLAYLANLFLTI